MKLSRHEQGQLFIQTAAAVARAIARKFYGRPELIARYSQDAAQAQIDEQVTRSASRTGKRNGRSQSK